MEATYYKELTEECAQIHGWQSEDRDGEAACWMYRQILLLQGQNSELLATCDYWKAQDTYRLKVSVILAGAAFLAGWLLL